MTVQLQPLALGQQPSMYPFVTEEHLSAETKQVLLTDWILFILSGFAWPSFTPNLYRFLYGYCQYSAQDSPETFWLFWFKNPEHFRAFLNQPAEGYRLSHRGWRYGVCHHCRPDLCRPDYRGGIAETKCYFSGVDDPETLVEAGAPQLRDDPSDYYIVTEWTGNTVLNHSFYMRSNEPCLDLAGYIDLVVSVMMIYIGKSMRHLDFAVAPYSPHEPEASRIIWLQTLEWLRSYLDDVPPAAWPLMAPVWEWGSDPSLLKMYLNETSLVGIGGLALLMQRRDQAMLSELEALCRRHPGRLHIFGCDWRQAIEQVASLAASVDTSIWLDEAISGQVIFANAETFYLAAPPQSIQSYAALYRRQRCILNAKSIKAFMRNYPPRRSREESRDSTKNED